MSWNMEKHYLVSGIPPPTQSQEPLRCNFVLNGATVPFQWHFPPWQETLIQSDCCPGSSFTQSNIPFCTVTPTLLCMATKSLIAQHLFFFPLGQIAVWAKQPKRENWVTSLSKFLHFAWTHWNKKQKSPLHIRGEINEVAPLEITNICIFLFQ